MTTGTKKSKKKVVQKQWKGAVSYYLQDSDKKRIKSQIADFDIIAFAERIAADGLKLQIKEVIDSDAFRVDLYRAYTGYQDTGYMLTQRHDDLATALVAVNHILYEVFDGVMPAGDIKDTTW